jgi:carboxyl-terminal processing protease
MARWMGAAMAAGTIALSTIESAKAGLPATIRDNAATNSNVRDNPKALVDEAWQIVNREYVDPTFNRQDWQAIRRELLQREYNTRIDAYQAIRESLQRLGDPYTRFMDPRQFQMLTTQTSGETAGVGLRLENRERQIVVAEVLPNSPAAKAGINAGDVIVAIERRSTQRMTLQQAIDLVRGEAGRNLTITISRPGRQNFDVSLTRASLEIASVSYQVKNEGSLKVGYIRLTEFNAHSTEQMERAVKALNREGVKGFVLDLRGNPGGLLQASIEIARMWMNTGTIVRTVDRRGGNESFQANQSAISTAPLVVLVDGSSASASEILAGALKDSRRAIVVGSPTFGKALVQSIHPLADGSGLAVTVAHYYTPNGTDLAARGLVPDVRVDLTWAQQRQLDAIPSLLASAEDKQYQRAIAILQDPSQTIRQASNGSPN